MSNDRIRGFRLLKIIAPISKSVTAEKTRRLGDNLGDFTLFC
jgi:hypothetical protein